METGCPGYDSRGAIITGRHFRIENEKRKPSCREEMEQDRGERDRERDEAWAGARDAPSAGDSEQAESVSAPIAGTGLPMRSGHHVPI